MTTASKETYPKTFSEDEMRVHIELVKNMSYPIIVCKSVPMGVRAYSKYSVETRDRKIVLCDNITSSTDAEELAQFMNKQNYLLQQIARDGANKEIANKQAQLHIENMQASNIEMCAHYINKIHELVTILAGMCTDQHSMHVIQYRAEERITTFLRKCGFPIPSTVDKETPELDLTPAQGQVGDVAQEPEEPEPTTGHEEIMDLDVLDPNPHPHIVFLEATTQKVYAHRNDIPEGATYITRLMPGCTPHEEMNVPSCERCYTQNEPVDNRTAPGA